MAVVEEIKEAILAKIAEGNAGLKERIIDLKATEELERRKDYAMRGLTKLEQLQTEFQKIQPDHIIKDESGAVLQQGYTEKRLADRKKVDKTIKELQDALAKALGDADWSPLKKIVGEKDAAWNKASMPPSANQTEQ